MRATQAEISLANFDANLAYFRSRLGPSTRLCLAVKANAYGHGLPGLSWHAQALVDVFAVARLCEGETLRQSGITQPIILLSPHLREEIPELCKLDLEPLISHGAYLQDYQREAARCGQRLRLHLKVDTGMGRAGVLSEAAVDLAGEVLAYPNLELYGLCTHFASADEAHGEADTLAQLECFMFVKRQLSSAGITIPCVHAANSAATLRYPQAHFNMVRIGIGAYGYGYGAEELRPVLSLKTRIGLVKKIPCGHKVSYGGTWQAARASLLALLPIGYGDGYSRLLSNCGQVSLRGELCPVVGRVCMDQTVVDITEFAAQHPELDAADLLEHDVQLLGAKQGLNAQDIAAQLHSIPYEVLTSISPRVPRVYV